MYSERIIKTEQNDKCGTKSVKNNEKKNKYIEIVQLNGKPLNTPFFNHQEIANGGMMEIKMTDHPTKWVVQ